jgi:hypothetical protein
MDWENMTEREFMLASELDTAHRAAVHMARALRDIFNNVGHMLEVRADFGPVELYVQEFEDLDPNESGLTESEVAARFNAEGLGDAL